MARPKNSPKKTDQTPDLFSFDPEGEEDEGQGPSIEAEGLSQEESEALMAESMPDYLDQKSTSKSGLSDGEAPFDMDDAFFDADNDETPPPPSDVPAANDQLSDTTIDTAPSDAGTGEEVNIPLSQLAMQNQRPASSDYLEGLNNEQREAVELLDGPLLVLAGAGTGKTRVLTTRIAHILRTGRAASWQILSVTFTNKAAREMKHRIGSLVGEETLEGMPWLGTFHSIGVKILRRHAELVGLQSGFTILDMDDQMRLVKQVLAAENLDEKRWPARRFAGLVDSWKNRGLLPEKIPKADEDSFAGGRARELYQLYQNRLAEINACDFGDLLLLCVKLFQENPDILADYQRKFRFMMVDEYQDTNVCQYLWLRLLGQNIPNLCVVGDDDQSIYGWRGAEVDNILRFNKDFPEAKVIRLEQNYRSTGHILAAASGLIAHNSERLGKTLHTNIGEGEQVRLSGHWDDEEEASKVAEEIEILHSKIDDLNQVAILVRASFQMRAFEDRFVTMDIPYRVIGGPRFYERAEIKDAIAYLGCILNPANDLRFERIINVPKRGLGNASLKKIHEAARDNGLSLMRAAELLVRENGLGPAPRKSLGHLLAQFATWRDQLEEVSHTDLTGIILDESGYTDMLKKEKTQQAIGRLENLKELVRFMEEFENLASFLEHVSLVMDAETDETTQRVNLMTLHSAKGLEFNHVFLPGWEEGLFPHQRSLDESGTAGLEEERRLAYVGITRARKNAHISFVQNRRIHGRWAPAMPSRFIDELPQKHVAIAQSPMQQPHYGTSNFGSSGQSWKKGPEMEIITPGQKRAQNYYANKAAPKDNRPVKDWAKPGRKTRTTPVRKTENVDFQIGERVFHQKFGYGEIVDIENDNLEIDFEKSNSRKVKAGFVEKA